MPAAKRYGSRWPRENEHHRIPEVRVERLIERDARERAVATRPVR